MSKSGDQDGHKASQSLEESRVSRLQLEGQAGSQTQFSALLSSGSECNDYEAFIEYLKSLSPAKADLQIRSLEPVMRSEHNELADFVAALTQRLKTKRDFELVNAWMAVFLRIHSDTISSIGEDVDQVPGGRVLLKRLGEWKVEQQKESNRLSEMIGQCRGIVGFLRSAR